MTQSKRYEIAPKHLTFVQQHYTIMDGKDDISNVIREKKAARVTWVGFFTNLILSAAKIIAGIWGRSSAMIADGIHSLSDFITDFIVIIFIKISSKNEDNDHPYGHGKFETFATMLISFALFVVAIGIFYSGSIKIYEVLNGEIIERPTYLALAMAAVSIIVKEGLYWYTITIGRKIDSPAVIANGWHHRSDAFSSIGTLIGISGAMFLGERWRVLDPITSLVVGIFIFGVAYKLARPSIQELSKCPSPKKWNKILPRKYSRHPESSHSTTCAHVKTETHSSSTCTSKSTPIRLSSKRTTSPHKWKNRSKPLSGKGRKSISTSNRICKKIKRYRYCFIIFFYFCI